MGVCQRADRVYHVVGERGKHRRLKDSKPLRPALGTPAKHTNPDKAIGSLDKDSEQAILEKLKGMLPTITIAIISYDPKFRHR